MAPISPGRESWMEKSVQNTCAESVRYRRPLELKLHQYISSLQSLGQIEPTACVLNS